MASSLPPLLPLLLAIQFRASGRAIGSVGPILSLWIIRIQMLVVPRLESAKSLILIHIFPLIFKGLNPTIHPAGAGEREVNKELRSLIAKARKRKMTRTQLEAQQVSFAYGNAPKGSKTTKKSVRAALRFTSPASASR